jgi:hypothetical protein
MRRGWFLVLAGAGLVVMLVGAAQDSLHPTIGALLVTALGAAIIDVGSTLRRRSRRPPLD